MLFEQRPTERTAAMRAGWNDAAWGRPRRAVEPAWARWYEVGSQGGAAHRRARQDQVGEPAYKPATERIYAR